MDARNTATNGRTRTWAVLPALCMGMAWWMASTGAQAHRAHVHGVAQLEVAVDGQQLELALLGPQDNYIGFEHPPRTPAQKKAHADMLKRLEQAGQWFLTNPEARCSVTAQDAETDAEVGGAHADIEVTVSFTCQAPEQLRQLVVMPWQAMPRLRQLQATVVTPAASRKVNLKRPAGDAQVVLELGALRR
ncbi:MAG: DUF2796 domain-containing protein [Aquabacterium sp.]